MMRITVVLHTASHCHLIDNSNNDPCNTRIDVRREDCNTWQEYLSVQYINVFKVKFCVLISVTGQEGMVRNTVQWLARRGWWGTLFSDSKLYSGVELWPWTFLWDLILYLLLWTVPHINRSLHRCVSSHQLPVTRWLIFHYIEACDTWTGIYHTLAKKL